jgi:hypothetical protein
MQSAMAICSTDSTKRRRVITTADDDATKQCRCIVSNDDGTSVSAWKKLDKPKRQVQFSSHSSLILYNGTHHQDYDNDEEQVSSWYTREEETQFRQAIGQM